MTVIRTWSGNGLSAGTLSASSAGTGDTAFSSIGGTGTIAITTDGTRSPRLTWPATSASVNPRWNALGNLTTWSIRRYFSIDTMPAATWTLAAGFNSAGGAIWRVEVSGSGLLRLRNASAAVWSPTSPTLLGATEYRLEVVGSTDGTTGSATVYLYQGESTTPLVTSPVTTIEPTSFDEIRWGAVITSTAAQRGDDFAVANTATLIGAVAPVTPPTNHTVKKWAGTGLAAGALTTSSAGTGDTAFTSVTGVVNVTNNGYSPSRITLDDAAGIKRFGWWPLSTASLPQYAMRWYMTIGALPASEVYVANGLLAGAGSWSIRITASGFLRLRDDASATVLWTAGTALPINTLIRIEVVVGNAGAATVTAYTAHTTQQIVGTTSTLSAPTIDEARFGFTSSVASTAYTYDTIQVDDQAVAIGPDPNPKLPSSWFRLTASGWQPYEAVRL